MMVLSIATFIGRFHPVIVHLPIGILLVAMLVQLLSFQNKYAALAASVPILLVTGMISAVISCITGYLLSLSGDYQEGALTPHMWMGIGVAVISVLLVAGSRRSRTKIYQATCFLLLFVLMITGHLGGSLTHGEGYLMAGLNDSSATEKKVRPPIADVQQALAFKDVIRPIIEEKCFSCHGATKQKGRLRMDDFDAMMKGGKNGKIITAGKPNESEMVKRIELPLNDEHHMSPKDKTQITDNELMLLKWWIETGASSVKKVGELAQEDKIKPRLLSLQSGTNEEPAATELAIPDAAVERGDAATIKLLQQNGAVVIPVARDKNYLEINFIGDSIALQQQVPLLLKLKAQIISLKLSNTAITDKSMEDISRLSQLIQLNLSNTPLTDLGISQLARLKNLRVLNLVGTGVTAAGLMKLKELANLKSVYLFRSKVKAADWKGLQEAFKNVQLDSGGYTVPLFESDTTELRYKPNEN